MISIGFLGCGRIGQVHARSIARIATAHTRTNEDLLARREVLQAARIDLSGEDDQIVAPAQGSELAARLPRATLRRLPGLGHLGHEEDPALFRDLLFEIADAEGA